MGPSGQFGPPQKSGNSTGLIVVVVVLLVAAVGGLAFFLTSGDDDDDTAGDQGDQQGQDDGLGGIDQNDPPAGGDDPASSGDTGDTGDSGDTGDTGDSGDSGDTGGSGDTLSITSEWVYNNTPDSVDESESACIAELVIDVVGEDAVEAESGDLQEVWNGTTGDQDSAISSAIGGCLDSESVDDMSGWVWPPD